MFVCRYPDYVASITFHDGHTDFFDGVKDMFKYLFNLDKYSPGHKREDIRAIYVTEYYDIKSIDGFKAFFVIGSDVYGPMGNELIPFQTLPDAEMFKNDHQGKRIVTFHEVTQALIRQLD